MPLSINCPRCQAEFSLPDELAGKWVRCAKCQETFSAPAVALPVAAAPAPASSLEAAIQTEPNPIQGTASPWADAESNSGKRARPPREDERQRSGGGLAVVLIVTGVAILGVGLLSCLGLAGAGMFFTLARHHRVEVVAADHAAVAEAPAMERNAARPPINDPAPIGIPKGDPPLPIENLPNVPAFQEAPNPFPPGAQLRVRELQKFKGPDGAAQLIFSPKHNLLFVRNAVTGVWVVDAKTGQVLGKQAAAHQFSDLALAPDQSALFAADYGGTRIGHGEPLNPSHVHRYDLAARQWERRTAPKIAFRIEAVDAWRFLLQEQDQWVNLTLNRWEQKGARVEELSRISPSFYYGDIEYDPRTGRICHGSSGSSSREIIVCQVVQDTLRQVDKTGVNGTANKAGGGTATLSADGSRFYYGKLQVDARNVKNNLRVFDEPIVAASRDLAFGKLGYYNAQTGAKLADLGFPTTVQAVSPDNMFLWAFDPSTNMLHQFALEANK